MSCRLRYIGPLQWRDIPGPCSEGLSLPLSFLTFTASEWRVHKWYLPRHTDLEYNSLHLVFARATTHQADYRQRKRCCASRGCVVESKIAEVFSNDAELRPRGLRSLINSNWNAFDHIRHNIIVNTYRCSYHQPREDGMTNCILKVSFEYK